MCDKHDKYYTFNLDAYKRAQLQNLIEPFCESLKPCYYKSKTFYVERKLNYTKFCTLIRQLCNYNNISFTTKIIYNKSKYIINYYIYKEDL